MNDALTSLDIKKMKEELTHRKGRLMQEQLEEVKRTRAFGDLSENFEYKAAKQALNRNKGRIRYLEKMISSAKVIEDTSAEDEVGLFDRVTLFMPDDDETEIVRVVTTIRTDPLSGLISREAPLGRAILGKRAGDKVTVVMNDAFSYDVIIRSIEKMSDDGSAPLLQY